jgi:RNA polymerase sigma-70 factor, ECF subfamily
LLLQMLDGNASGPRAHEAEIWRSDDDPSAGQKARSHMGAAAGEEAGGEAAFSALVERQGRFVFRVAYAMLRYAEDAEDVVQETFLKLYRNGSWREIRDERGFLARATWRVALDHLSARRADRGGAGLGPQGGAGKASGDELLAGLRSAGSDPEQAAVAGDWHATIHRLIDALPEELRQPLALSSVEGLSSREIAAVMGVPEGTVRTRLMRARQVLKQKMASFSQGRRGG